MVMIIEDTRAASGSEFADLAKALDEERVFVSYTNYEQARWSLAELWERMQERQRLAAGLADFDPVRLVVRQSCITLLDPALLDYVAGIAEQGRAVGINVTLQTNRTVAQKLHLLDDAPAGAPRWLSTTPGLALRASLRAGHVDTHLTDVNDD